MTYTQPPFPESQEPVDPSARVCTACRSTELDPGFVEDRGQGSQGYAHWVPGPLETGVFGGARLMGKDRWQIEAWRCRRCGHLESYAVTQL